MKQEYISDILNTPSIALLRSKNCAFILEFLSSVFEKDTAILYENFHQQLVEYLSINANTDKINKEDEEQMGISYIDTYEEKAKKYIKYWTNNHFLQNYINDKGETYYELSSHSSKVIDWLPNLKREAYIGTESKFKSIITQVRELVEYTNEDKTRRLQLLKKKKEKIQEQIDRLEMGENIEVFEEYEIIPRFKQINKLAKELFSDFKEVDDNFKLIIKEIYQKQIDPKLNKGDILQYTFDSLDELKSSSQGKSFYAFWEYLLDKQTQPELDYLIEHLFHSLEERKIEYTDTFLQNMIPALYNAGKKVNQTNYKMAEKLSRIIRENDISNTDKTKQIIQEIKNLLIEISKTQEKPDIQFFVDDQIEINIPFERGLTLEKTENIEYTMNINLSSENVKDNLDKLISNFAYSINKNILKNNIIQVLETKNQTTLSEVIEQHPLQQDLPELCAYFYVINQFKHKNFNEDEKTPVLLNKEQQKYIHIPEIIIVKE